MMMALLFKRRGRVGVGILRIVPDSDIKLMVYTAATGSRDAERLERLRADTERADPEDAVTRRTAPALPS